MTRLVLWSLGLLLMAGSLYLAWDHLVALFFLLLIGVL